MISHIMYYVMLYYIMLCYLC